MEHPLLIITKQPDNSYLATLGGVWSQVYSARSKSSAANHAKKDLAKLKITFRMRSAGAGRKRMAGTAGAKRINIVVRVRPDVKAGFEARALANGTSAGEELDKAFDATRQEGS